MATEPAHPADFFAILDEHDRRLRALEGTGAQSVGFVLNAGTFTVLDGTGRVVNIIGKQEDGTYDISTVDPTNPGNYVKLSTLGFDAVTDTDDATVSTASTTEVGLSGGPQVTVSVGPTGRVLCSWSAFIGLTVQNEMGVVGMGIDGAGSANLNRMGLSLSVAVGTVAIAADCAVHRVISGLSEGYHTFKLLYRTTQGTTVNFSRRTLIVQPF